MKHLTQNGRRTKTLLPTSNQLLKHKLPEEVDQKVKFQKVKQSLHYNKGAKELEELSYRDSVIAAQDVSVDIVIHTFYFGFVLRHWHHGNCNETMLSGSFVS